MTARGAGQTCAAFIHAELFALGELQAAMVGVIVSRPLSIHVPAVATTHTSEHHCTLLRSDILLHRHDLQKEESGNDCAQCESCQGGGSLRLVQH